MNTSLKPALNHLRLLVVALFAMLSSLAQEKTVQGRVSDNATGSPIAGASVTLKGGTSGVITDANGNFSIKVSSASKQLTVSFSGYTSTDVDIATGVLDIKLSSTSSTLGEVVVIGYGAARKKDLTGSVASISSKDFVKGALTTPEQLIQGKVAGVQITSNSGAPGAGSTIRIRGGASLNASNDPLIVVDGMPLDNSGISGQANPLSLINPNDIENFTILKDASAAAIYGSRASNGVIMITTRKGASGKPMVSFSSLLSVGKIAKKADVLTGDEIRDFVNANGNASLKALLGQENTDWQDQIYQNALTSDNNISVRGSIKKLPYRVSLGYLNQNGILKTGNLARTTLGLNLNPTLFDNHLKIDFNIKSSMSQSVFANEGSIGSAVNFDPTKPVYSGKNDYGGYWEWLDPTSATGLKALSPKNPLGILMQRDDRSDVSRHIANVLADYKFHFLPELRAVVNAGADIADGTGTIVVPEEAASTFKRFKDASNKFHGGVNNEYRQKRQNAYLNAYLNYAKEIESIKTRVDLTAGYEYQDYLTTNYNFSDKTFDNTVVTTPNFEFDKPQYRLSSMLGRANISIMSKYLITASIRQDGSSKFNVDNRFGLFPSAAFAWKLNEESFLKNSKTINDLKLRIGYGVTGQQDGIGYYDYISYYNLSSLTAQYQFGNTYYQMFRPGGYYFNRKWEQTATTNLAVDFGLLDGRVSGTVELYKRETKDLLNEINQPAGTNFSNKIVANVGTMENKGVEFTLNLQPIRKRNLTWDVSFNATYNQNTITKLTISEDPNYAGARFGGISGGTGNTIMIHSVGYNRGAFFVYKQVYDQTGKPIDNLFSDLNRDGIINEKDLYQYKGVDPRMFFGFSTNVSSGKWNAGLVARANVGNYMYNNVASSTGTVRNILNPIGYINNGSRDVLVSGFSGNGANYYLSDYYIQNASFFRMDNINVGYNLGKVFKDRANMRLSANVQNAFVITKYTGLDPEINGGIDNNFYPRPRTFVLGVNLDF
ncbi:MAG: SusC/RagA family TonB-linked outer membrane protein [Bacteroidota bacterium]|jgi:TonB-linked SusC/RagA family outer membrane protein